MLVLVSVVFFLFSKVEVVSTQQQFTSQSNALYRSSSHKVAEVTCEDCCQINSEYSMKPNTVVYLTQPRDGDQSRAYVECRKGRRICFQEEFADLAAEEIPCSDRLLNLLNKRRSSKRHLGVQVKFKSNRWPGGYVCYGYTTNTFTTRQLDLVDQSIKIVANQTNIRFLTVSECRNGILNGSLSENTCNQCKGFIVITKNKEKGGCYSNVGMVGNPQALVLNDACFESHNFTAFVKEGAVAIHELGHAVGLFHEHQHRDRSIMVLWRNIKSKYISNFVPVDPYAAFTEYDKNSIMHYSEYFSNLPKELSTRILCEPLDECTEPKRMLRTSSTTNCIPKGTKICGFNEDPSFDDCVYATENLCKPLNHEIGQTISLSRGDIHAINKMYPYIRNDTIEVPEISYPSVGDIENRTSAIPISRDELGSASSGAPCIICHAALLVLSIYHCCL